MSPYFEVIKPTLEEGFDYRLWQWADRRRSASAAGQAVITRSGGFPMSDVAGRSCPLRYRYGAEAIARSPVREAETLYVVGGLYGNLPALAAIETLAADEAGPVTLCFNGDFNWFNVDDAGFAAINAGVQAQHAILGNVEAELGVAGAVAGCGCAYPDHVDAAIVERSNRIHARLKATAWRHPAVVEQLAALPMFARYQIGDCRIGIVHGDADSLAGWRFDRAALDDPENRPWLSDTFRRAAVDVFASTHTCLPALRQFAGPRAAGVVINNGAAGMPNFNGRRSGVVTRIGTVASPHPILYGTVVGATHVDALEVPYDAEAWERAFLTNWPAGSDAYQSYFRRIDGCLA